MKKDIRKKLEEIFKNDSRTYKRITSKKNLNLNDDELISICKSCRPKNKQLIDLMESVVMVKIAETAKAVEEEVVKAIEDVVEEAIEDVVEEAVQPTFEKSNNIDLNVKIDNYKIVDGNSLINKIKNGIKEVFHKMKNSSTKYVQSGKEIIVYMELNGDIKIFTINDLNPHYEKIMEAITQNDNSTLFEL